MYAFRGGSEAEKTHAFRLQGLDATAQYRIRLHDSGAAQIASGRDLMGRGLDLSLNLPNSSELIFIELAK